MALLQRLVWEGAEHWASGGLVFALLGLALGLLAGFLPLVLGAVRGPLHIDDTLLFGGMLALLAGAGGAMVSRVGELPWQLAALCQTLTDWMFWAIGGLWVATSLGQGAPGGRVRGWRLLGLAALVAAAVALPTLARLLAVRYEAAMPTLVLRVQWLGLVRSLLGGVALLLAAWVAFPTATVPHRRSVVLTAGVMVGLCLLLGLFYLAQIVPTLLGSGEAVATRPLAVPLRFLDAWLRRWPAVCYAMGLQAVVLLRLLWNGRRRRDIAVPR